jgi:hypothetical protein
MCGQFEQSSTQVEIMLAVDSVACVGAAAWAAWAAEVM